MTSLPIPRSTIFNPSVLPLSGVSRMFKTATLACAALALAGCAGLNSANSVDQQVRATENEVIAAQIDAALARVSDQPMWSNGMDNRAAFASFATEHINVSYQGDAANLLKAIAAARGLGFSVTGPQPHIPIFVFVETNGQPYIDFLTDLDRQFGQRADIVLGDTKLELRYR